MRALLVYPLFPKSFWSFEKALALVDKKALLPPLGLITVAAILPQEWEFRLIDRNIEQLTEQDWDWAEIVILSGMIVQKTDLLDLVDEAKRRGIKVAVGGPYATALPEEVTETDYLVLDEGEITLPMFVEALERGEASGFFRAEEKPDVTTTPIPRFDLLKFSAYDNLSVQFSRGCPFQCEFCDIIVLYGRKPRTKTPSQLICELERLYDLGWRGSVFLVDDNFIGNKRNVKLLLKELQAWITQRNYPFSFSTEASVDLAQDTELMDLMVECNFKSVFLGIETPDEASLKVTKKFQNTRDSLSEAIDAISKRGLRIMAGFIIGFDGEQPNAGNRIIEFIERTNIPIAMFSMLQALPNTALWHRLDSEQRLVNQDGNINQTTLMNFVPTRPITDIANEFVDAFWQLYEPEQYLARTFRHFMSMEVAPKPTQRLRMKSLTIQRNDLRALLTLSWRQGVVRKTRWQFWHNLGRIVWKSPHLATHYLTVCAFFEHFYEYRQVVRDQIQGQLQQYLAIGSSHHHDQDYIDPIITQSA